MAIYCVYIAVQLIVNYSNVLAMHVAWNIAPFILHIFEALATLGVLFSTFKKLQKIVEEKNVSNFVQEIVK